MKLKDQIALITGGSRGIGRATALLFAQEGADIAFCHLNDDAKAEETAAEIRTLGRRAMHASVDVSDIAAGKAFARPCRTRFRPDRHPVQQRRDEHPQAVRSLYRGRVRPDHVACI